MILSSRFNTTMPPKHGHLGICIFLITDDLPIIQRSQGEITADSRQATRHHTHHLAIGGSRGGDQVEPVSNKVDSGLRLALGSALRAPRARHSLVNRPRLSFLSNAQLRSIGPIFCVSSVMVASSLAKTDSIYPSFNYPLRYKSR